MLYSNRSDSSCLSPMRPTGLSFPLQNAPRSLRQLKLGFTLLIPTIWKCFLFQPCGAWGCACHLNLSCWIREKKWVIPPQHCCAVRKTMFFSNAISSFKTTLRRVEIKQVRSVLVVYLLPPLQKGLIVSTHTWTLMRPLVFFVLHCLQSPLFALCMLCFWTLRLSVSQMLIATCS